MWLEFRISGVDGEVAEAVSEVLTEPAGGRVVVEERRIRAETERERVAPSADQCTYCVRAFLEEEDPGSESTRQRVRGLEEKLWHLRAIREFPAAEVVPVPEVDWSEAWKESHTRIRPAERIVILPPWDEAPLKVHELPVVIEPGVAFGVGSHPSTQLCVALLEKTVREGDRVLDVGCGTGVLTVAAARLGAARVDGCDLDAVAVEATRDALSRNGVEPGELFVGSIDAASEPVDLIVINILASVIAPMLPDVVRLLRPGGRFVFGGILDSTEAALREALQASSLELDERLVIGEWIGLAGRSGESEGRSRDG